MPWTGVSPFNAISEYIQPSHYYNEVQQTHLPYSFRNMYISASVFAVNNIVDLFGNYYISLTICFFSPFLHICVPLFYLPNRYLGIFLSDVENIATESIVTTDTKKFIFICRWRTDGCLWNSVKFNYPEKCWHYVKNFSQIYTLRSNFNELITY